MKRPEDVGGAANGGAQAGTGSSPRVAGVLAPGCADYSPRAATRARGGGAAPSTAHGAGYECR